MDENRFNRLEDKVDRVDDKVDKITLSLTELKTETRIQMDTIKEHIEADTKIVNHIHPLLPILNDLAEMVQDHKYTKAKKEENITKLKHLSLKFGVILSGAGVITLAVKVIKKLLA